MEALTGKRFIDDPASAIVINSKPITSADGKRDGNDLRIDFEFTSTRHIRSFIPGKTDSHAMVGDLG